jgi:hypothetical protein
MKAGEYTTSTTLSGDLKNIYRLETGLYRWVTNSAAISNAGGKAVVHTITAGAVTGTVVETTTATDYKVAGVIPIGATSTQGGAITATTTLAANSYFLIQLSGASQVQANTTASAGATLITTTTAGQVGSMATGVEASVGIIGVLGYATNSAVATVANGLITCVLTRVA